METVFAEFVVLCSLLVDGICSNVLWDLRYVMLDQIHVFIPNQTYRRVECRIEKGNVCCFGQLLVNSFDNGQGTCVVAMISVSYVKISYPRNLQRCKIRQLLDMMISLPVNLRRLIKVSSMNHSVACKLNVLLVLKLW